MASKKTNSKKRKVRRKASTSSKKRASSKARKARKKRWLIAGVIVALSIIVLIVSLAIYKRKSEESGAQAVGNDVTDVNVLLKNEDNKTWENVTIACDNGMVWSENNETHSASSGEYITFSNKRPEGTVIELQSVVENGRFTVKGSEVKGDNYPGKIQLHYTTYGLEVTNYVPLEEYIKGVICSEMPERYGLEALKAQAVCARSYILSRGGRYAYEESLSDVDDTVSYQVYGKEWAGGDALKAVNDTAGMVVFSPDGSVANTMFYSTSCGYTQTQKSSGLPYLARKYVSLSDNDYLKEQGVSTVDDVIDTNDNFEEAFSQYIRNDDENALEREDKYFRWDTKLDMVSNDSKVKDTIARIFDASNSSNDDRIVLDERLSAAALNGKNSKLNKDSIGSFKSMKVLRRSTGGAIISLSMEFENGCVIINDELIIRRVLGAASSSVSLNDGSSREVTSLHSSAFTMVPIKNGYHLYGGGYGHGCGMSQDAAKELAGQGKNYIDIIKFFYKDCTVDKVI